MALPTPGGPDAGPLGVGHVRKSLIKLAHFDHTCHSIIPNPLLEIQRSPPHPWAYMTTSLTLLSIFGCCLHVVASHAGDFRGARVLSLPTNACSTENDIPFPSLANHIVLSKFWKVELDHMLTR